MGIYGIRGSFFLGEKDIRFIEKWLVIGIIFITLVLTANTALATEASFTDILDTKAFRGSWDIVSKLDWVGKGLSITISVASVIGLASVFYQTMATMMYFAARPLFDNIYELKQEVRGTRFLNLEGIKNSLATGKAGTGIDAIITVGLTLFPNIKAYSEYNPERMGAGLDENDTMIQYMLKTALPKIVIIFFLSTGFNGTLPKAYGTVVDGMSAVADKAVDVNLEAMVTRWANTGESYKFTLGSSNTAEGEFAEKIAKDLYSKVLSRGQLISTESRLQAGLAVENWVYQNILGNGTGASSYNKLNELLSKSGTLGGTVSSPEEVKALRWDIVLNTNPDAVGGVSASVRLSSLIPSLENVGTDNLSYEGKNLTAHIIVTKDKVSEANFFTTN